MTTIASDVHETRVTRVRSPRPRDGSGYISQLDALRTFAVFGVLVTHYLSGKSWVADAVPWGAAGVRLFFTISGYLITGILLRARQAASESGQGVLRVARQFYIRRFLRIFPLFYVTLAVAYLAAVPNIRESIWWHATYLSNFWTAQHGWIMPAHFWSLAVEEQFYLLWPWLILFLPRRWLAPTCIALICGGVMYRLIVTKMGGWLWGTAMMPGCLDTLGAGALLAVARSDLLKFSEESVNRFVFKMAAIGIPLSIVVMYLNFVGIRLRDIPMILEYTLYAMVFCWVINCCIRGVKGVAGEILSFPPLLYLGKISYGIYVLHIFVPVALRWLAQGMHLEYPSNPYVQFIVQGAATVVVAAVSWHFFEKPLNDLKRSFPYTTRPVKVEEAK